MDVILMQNIDYNFDRNNLKLYSFDLKGSVVNRKDKVRKGKTLKCQNFVEINQSKHRLVKLDTE